MAEWELVDFGWFENAVTKAAETRNEAYLTMLQLCHVAALHDADAPKDQRGAVGQVASQYKHSAAWVKRNAQIWEAWKDNEDVMTPDTPPFAYTAFADFPDPRHAMLLYLDAEYRKAQGIDDGGKKDRLSVREVKRIVYGETDPGKAGATFRWRGPIENWDVAGQTVTIGKAAISGDPPTGDVEAVLKEIVK